MLLYVRNDIVVNIMVSYGLSWHRHHPNTLRDLTVFFWGGARRGYSACYIQSCLWMGVTVPVSQRTSSRDNTKTPTPQSGINSTLVRAPTLRCFLWGEVSVWQFPDLGRFWGRAYIYRIICGTLPLASRPLGESDRWWMVVSFTFSFGFGLLMDRCHTDTHQMVKIRRLGIEFTMVKAIQTSGHTCGWW